ncbi:Na(+)/H(+) antiporter subunit E [compost metagenome]
MKKIFLALELIAIFMWDFIWAVLEVGSWIFRPNSKLQPAIVRMRTVLQSDKALWILSLIIFLTPGSLIVETVEDEDLLYIHFFHTTDPEQSVSHIRERFESRLRELFEKGGTR